jgi:predicted O-methyltransferase YrrM
VLTLVELAELDGLISAEVGEYLLKLASRVPSDQAIVELGSYRGKSTCYLATGSAESNRARVYAIDAWSEEVSAWRKSVLSELPSPLFDDFLSQIAKADVEEIVTPIRSLTALAAEGYTGEPVALLYIDGDHHQEAALADFRAWRRHLTDDAVIIFDDYGVTKNIGVTEAVTILRKSGEFLDPVQMAGGRLAVGKPGTVIGSRVPGVQK